ncbi:MAG: phosphate/phosphite/phosphonate ABC transporter substrate-binding protein, partial [Desulfuromonas sp.]
EGVTYYRRLVEYLEDQLGRPIHVIDKGSYQEFNSLLKKGELDIAFVCSGSYVNGHDQFGLELLVVPIAPSGEKVYYSYLVVPTDSTATSMADLKGKRFAYTDPMSNTGKLCPDHQIRLLDEDPATFFNETMYTYAHDRSLDAIIEGLVDGAAIDSLIYDYLAQTKPDITSKTKIIARSDPFGIPPVVIRPDLPQPLRERLKKEFLQMHNNPEGVEILAGMMLKRFEEGNDADYDSVRQMRKISASSPVEE